MVDNIETPEDEMRLPLLEAHREVCYAPSMPKVQSPRSKRSAAIFAFPPWTTAKPGVVPCERWMIACVIASTSSSCTPAGKFAHSSTKSFTHGAIDGSGRERLPACWYGSAGRLRMG